jgi:hypothetical protein
VSGTIQYGPAQRLNTVPTRARKDVRVADANRFATDAHPKRSVALLFGAAMVIGGVLTAVPREIPGMAIATVVGGAWLSLVLAVMLPGRAERAAAELVRRLGQFRHAINAAGDEPTRDSLEGLLRYARALELRDEDISGELTSLRASLDGLELTARLERGDLPVVAATGLAPGDACRFMAAARFGRRCADQFGHVLLTDGWFEFRGAFDVSVAWSEVSQVERAGTEIIVQLRDTRRMLRCSLLTVIDATRAGVLAQHLTRRANVTVAVERSFGSRTTASPA